MASELLANPPAPPMPPEDGAPQKRLVRLFRNGANQAVRIPKEFELPGKEALIHRDGDRLVIEPPPQVLVKGSAAALLTLLATMDPIEEGPPPLDEAGP